MRYFLLMTICSLTICVCACKKKESGKFVGVYYVSDSTDNLLGPPGNGYFHQQYVLKIDFNQENESILQLTNPCNLGNPENDIIMIGKVDDDSLKIEHGYYYTNGFLDYDLNFRGKLIGDSIYFSFDYSAGGDPYWGAGSAQRIN